MVGSLTVGKKRYADVEEDIIRCKKKQMKLQSAFLNLWQKMPRSLNH